MRSHISARALAACASRSDRLLQASCRVEAAACKRRLRRVSVRTGLTGPSQTARQPGEDLSATGDAELGQVLLAARSSHGCTRVGPARLKL
jgi:hypothetical protein